MKAKHTEMRQWFGRCGAIVSLMFLSSFFVAVGHSSAQINNSSGFSSGADVLPQWVAAIATQGQDQVEVIPFRLDEDLFGEDEGNVVKVSLRVFNILQHFVAIPVALSPKSGDNKNETNPVVDLEFDRPGMHYASWDRLDHAGKQVVPGVYFVQLYVESDEASYSEPDNDEVRVPRRGGVRGFLNTISPGDPFKQTVVDASDGESIESDEASNSEPDNDEVRVPRRGGVRGFLNTISPGDPFKQTVVDASDGESIESDEASNSEPDNDEVRVPRRGGVRGFLNTISPGDPFKETVVDVLPMDTRNTVMRIVIS